MPKNIRVICAPIAIILFSATACRAAPVSTAVDVTNVKSGLICPYSIDNEGGYEYDPRVCFETEEINITGQGQCVFNGERKLCSWYGFEFEYNNKTENPVPLNCHFSSNRQKTFGNPKEILDDDASSYEIMLEPGINHFSNPQYTVFQYSPMEKKSININTCEIDGHEVFTARFNVIIPAKP